MNRKDLIFISIAVGVIGLFIFLSVIGKKPKPLTAEHHPGVTDKMTREQCLECHGAAGVSPMPANHPQKGKEDERRPTNCYVCHRPPQPATAAVIILSNRREVEFVWPSPPRK
jgi:hypothetical protein